MYWETDLDSSGLQRGLDRSEQGVQQFANNASSGFSALAVAAGTLLAGAVEKLAGGIMAIGKNAISATADMQAMQVGLEGLLAREIARGEEATRSYQVTSSLNANEQQQVTDLTLKLDQMNAKLQEKKQHLWEIQNKWTDQGLAAQTAAADIAVYENNIAKTAAQLEALLGKQGQVNTVTEKYWINTTSISEALPIAQEKAKALMDELARIAILSPYQVESVQATFKQAMAFGFGSEEASKFTSAIMNVAAGTGASNEMLQRMGYNLAQVRMQGRVTAVDIRQLAMAGFDLNGVLQSVGKQFGVNIRTHEDFNAAIANGSITWEQFTDGFAKYADDNFGGASERMSRTLNGLKSTFADLFTLTMPKVVGPALEEITGLLNDMLSSFLKIRESGVLDEMGKKLGDMAKGLVSGLRGLTKLPGVLKELRSMDPNDFAGIYYVLEQLPEGLRGLAKGLNDLAGAFDEGGLAGVFGELFDMAVDWWQSGGSEWLGSMVTAAWEWIQKIPGEIGAKVKDLADDATQILRNVWEALYKWWDSGGSEWVSTTADTVWGYVTQLPGKIAEKIGNFVTGAKEWLVGAWNAIHEWWDSGGETWATETARKVWDAVQKLPGKIGELLTGAGMEVGGWLADVWNGLNAWWDGGGETWASETAEKIGTAIDTLRNFLTGEDAPQVLKDAAAWLEPVWMQMATWWETSAEPLVNDMLAGFDSWMNTQFVPALQNQDKSTWARGVADALASGFDQAVAYLSEPIYIEKIAYALGNFLTQVLIDLSFLPLGLLQLVFDAIFGGEGEEVDTSRAEEWVLALVNGLLMGIEDAFAQSPVIQSVIDWFGRMIDGIKEFLGISIGGHPSIVMAEIGVEIINGMLAGIVSMATATMATVQNFVTDNIVRAVNWTTRLIEVGKDIITGLIKGLGEKKQDVINWILSLVGDIVAAVKRMLGIESPSRVFAEIGRYIITGLIDGIRSTTPAAVAAMAEMIDKVMGALNAVVGGVSAVLNMGEIGDILPSLRILVEHVKSIISILSDLAGYYANSQALNRAANVIEPLADIASGLRSVVEAASSIAAAALDVKPAELANMGAVLTGLFDLIGQVIGEVVDLAAGYNVNQLIQATMLAETIWPVLEAFGLAAELIEPLTRVSPASIETKATALVAAMGALIKKITHLAADIPPEVLANSARVAEKIIAALKPWEVMIDAYNAFADLVLRSGIGAKANALTAVIERLVMKVTWLANSIGEDTLVNSARVASMIVTALKPWEEMIATYTALAEMVISSGIGERANALAVVVERLVMKITWLANSIGEDILVNSARVGELIIAALVPWKEMVDAVNAVGSYTQIEGVGKKARLLTGAVEVLAVALSTMADRLGIEVLEKAQRVGRMLSDVLAPWEKAIKLTDEMRAWQIMPDLEDRMIRFARQWVTIVESLSEAVGVLTDDGMEAVAAFGITLEALMGGLQEALVLAVNLPAQWSEPVSWDAFVSWVQDAFMEFYVWLNGWGGGDTRPPVPFFDDGALDLVGRFGEVLGQLMGGLQAALDLALALPAEWTEPPSWDAFVAWVQDAFLEFYNWINGWGGSDTRPPIPSFNGTELDMVGLFGDALGALMGGLQAALNLALALPAEWTEPASWDTFVTWVQGAFLLFMDWVTEHFPTPEDPDAPDQFGAILGFSQALGALMGGLQAALGVALALPAEWTEPPSWDNFTAWVQGVFVEFVTWVNTAFPMRLNPEDGDIFGAVTAFGEALGALMDGLSAALGLALALPETWTAPSAEMWDTFFGWVTDVFDAFMDYVTLNYPQDPDEAAQFEPIAAFGGAMQAVFDGLLAALDLFVNLAAWAGPSSTFNTRLHNFLQAVSGAISDIAAFIASDPNLNPENLASVAVFGEALSELVGGLSDALDLFAQLADTDPSVYTESTLFEDRVGNLLLAIGGTMDAFSTWILGPQGQVAWLEDAGDFYDAIDAVFQVLHDALNLFIDLEESGMPPTPEIQAFVTAITDLFDTVAIQLGGLAQPGGALALAIAAVEAVIVGFPATMDTYQDEWWDAAGALAGQLPAAMVGMIGSSGTANTINWALQEIQNRLMSLPGWWTTNVGVPAWYNAGVDFAQALIDGMMSLATGVFDAGEALALAGLDGFNAGSGLAGAMANMAPDGFGAGGWQMDSTHRWEISLVGVGSPTGYDLSTAAVDQITDMLRTKLARGG